MNQLTYIPGTVGADAIGLDGGGSFVGIASNLRSRAWAYKLGYRDIETANRPAREVSLDFETDYATADAFRRAADADVLARTPGMFLAQGEWRQRGYITSSEPSYIHYGRLGVKLGCILLEGAWWRVRSQSFAAENTVIEDRYESATGEQVVTVGADSTPLHSLIVEGKSVQDGTPTPSNPVPIQIVEGINLIQYPYKQSSQVHNGITWTVNQDGTITANGTATALSYIVINDASMFGEHGPGTYTISGSPSITGCSIRLQRDNGSGDVISTDSVAGAAFTFTVSYPLKIASGNSNIFCMIASGTTVNNAVFKPQLNAGYSQPYVPYGALGLRVTGKNLFDTDTYKNWSAYTVAGSSGYYYTQPIFLKPNTTYTISMSDYSQVPSGYTVLKYYTTDGITSVNDAGALFYILGSDATNKLSAPKTFTTGTSGVIRLGANNASTGGNYASRNVMLEECATATDYEPYSSTVTPIPLDGNVLASLPDGTKDTLTVDPAGHVTLTNNVMRRIYDGSDDEGWLHYNYTAGHGYYLPTSSFSPVASNRGPNMMDKALCNRFVVDGSDAACTSGEMYFDSNACPDFVYPAVTTVEAWRTFLASNNVELFYKPAASQTVDLGYIEMPDVFDGAVVDVIAEVTPTITAEWKLANVVYLDYPHDYQYDYMKSSNNTEITTSVLTPSDVRITIFGAVSNPYIIVGDNRYQVNVTVPAGGYLEIDGRKKTITLTLADGTQQNVFGAGVRGSGMGGGEYIFEPIKGGAQQVQWSGAFGFDLAWYEDEGEPPWSR